MLKDKKTWDTNGKVTPEAIYQETNTQWGKVFLIPWQRERMYMKRTYYHETGMFPTTAVTERNVVARRLGHRACQKQGRTPNPCLSPHCPFVSSPLSLAQNRLSRAGEGTSDGWDTV